MQHTAILFVPNAVYRRVVWLLLAFPLFLRTFEADAFSLRAKHSRLNMTLNSSRDEDAHGANASHAASANALALAGYRHVPGVGGMMMHESCVQEVPNGGLVDNFLQSNCTQPYGVEHYNGDEQGYVMDAHTSGDIVFTQMNSSWVVPPLPQASNGQIVYFWPGLKATKPKIGYPVLQPVLQYGQGFSSGWELQSWFVWANTNSAASGPSISVMPGDKINSYINLDEASGIWTVYGEDSTTGKNSTLRIKKTKAGNIEYKYAMLVLETIMPAQGYCSLYPASSGVNFTGITGNRGQRIRWVPEVYKSECSQQVNISPTSDRIQMSWENGHSTVL